MKYSLICIITNLDTTSVQNNNFYNAGGFVSTLGNISLYDYLVRNASAKLSGNDVEAISPIAYKPKTNYKKFPSQTSSQFKLKSGRLARGDSSSTSNDKTKTPTIVNKSKLNSNYAFKRKEESVEEGSNSDTDRKRENSKQILNL
jgi:hypothetical protein